MLCPSLLHLTPPLPFPSPSLEPGSTRRFHRSLKRWNQSLKNKPIATKQNLQVETDPSPPLTLPCDVLCLIAILLTVGEMCFQMFPSEMPEVSPGGIQVVRCDSPRVKDLLAWAGLKGLRERASGSVGGWKPYALLQLHLWVAMLVQGCV